MVKDSLDAINVVFDDDRSVADAGALVAATLARRLGIEALVNECLDLGRRVGYFRPGRKVMSLVHAMLLGADSIDGCDVLRSGRTGRVLGHRVMAPSTLGTFLRAFSFGHVRQLDRVLGELLARAWRAGAGPGCERLVIDVDSFIQEVHGKQKHGASYGYTSKLGYHPLVATRSGSGEVLHMRFRTGRANSQRGIIRLALSYVKGRSLFAGFGLAGTERVRCREGQIVVCLGVRSVVGRWSGPADGLRTRRLPAEGRRRGGFHAVRGRRGRRWRFTAGVREPEDGSGVGRRWRES